MKPNAIMTPVASVAHKSCEVHLASLRYCVICIPNIEEVLFSKNNNKGKLTKNYCSQCSCVIK